MKYAFALAGLAATALAIPKHHSKTTKTKVHKTTKASSTIASQTLAVSSTTSSTPSPSSLPSNPGCVVTEFTAIPAAVANCTSITLKDIHAPSNQTIDLTKLLPHTTVTFAGTTTFEFTNISSFDPIVISGNDVTVTAEPDALLDGNGPIYWDGIGSNGGVPKPNHFIVLKKITGGVVKNLRIKNWPVHLFSISGCNNVDMYDLYLDNTEGNAPNNRSNGLAAAHNSDGFDLSSSNNFTIRDSIVLNQDDCVAVTSGDNVRVDNMYCDGGHGLSIGSVGGKSNNNVTNISFTNSVVLNSQNGPRIKTNSNTTGFISDITYRNITVQNIDIYGIDVQQDYLNGGPTGSPTNGVIIQNVLFEDIKGTAAEVGKNYYVLCGEGSCNNIKFVNVDITGGGKPSSCNLPAEECPII